MSQARLLHSVLVCIASAFFLATSAQGASATLGSGARILYFEPFTTKIDPRPALARKTSNVRQVKYEAYGRRFELALEPNEALRGASAAPAPSTASGVTLYRGQLMGKPGSWARIATRGSDVHGLVWDGTELYVIEPSAAVRDSLVPPLNPDAARTVMFRMSDTILESRAAFCSSPATPTKGDETYAALLDELRATKDLPRRMQAPTADLRLQLSAIGDASFRAQFDSDAAARDAMLIRLNNVDGIFSAEFGVELQVPTTAIYDTASDPLSATTSPTDLLDRLGALRQNSAELRATGVTHLFTGRDLDGYTVGIGYVDTLCQRKFAAGLTEIRGRGLWLESLITAHEIGHNFGSVHDGEESCSSVAQNQFLMSPTVFPANATFSSCSRNLIQASLSRASCVVALAPADLDIASDLGATRIGLGRTFEWELSVTNAGGRLAQAARLDVSIPAALSASDAWIGGGACAIGAGTVQCELGDVPAGATRTLHLELTGHELGANSLTAQLSSVSDANTLNDTGDGTIVIEPELDMAVTLRASVSNIDAGATFAADFNVTNTAEIAAKGTQITFALPTNVTAIAVSVVNGTCTLVPKPACIVPVLAPGQSATGSIDLRADTAGAGDISAQLSGDYFDPNQPNDVASQPITVVAGKTARSAKTDTNKGGGGSFSFLFIGALGAVGVMRGVNGRLQLC